MKAEPATAAGSPPTAGGSGERRCDAVERMCAIGRYDILDTPPEPNFDQIAALASAVCRTSSAAVSFVCDERQWFKAEVGIGIRETPIDQSFCVHPIGRDGLFVVPDAVADPAFSANDLVTGAFGLRFYAGAPFRSREGVPIGAVCVIDTSPRPEGLTELERQTLEVLARQVETHLELRRTLAERDRRVEEERKLSSALKWAAGHDELTGLPNRANFRTQLDRDLARACKAETSLALALVDVDHFKQVNDAHGHDVGDALLRTFAERLRGVVPSRDMVARIGGDEFALVLTADAAEAVPQIVALLQSRLAEPFAHRGRLFECRASIGVAVFPAHADKVDELVKCADLALTEAKRAGRACARFFEPRLASEFQREALMLESARRALGEKRILPYYQPKIDLSTGAVAGYEALLRWRQEDGGIGFPMGIAPAFRDRELSRAISDRMLSQVLADMRGWIDRGLGFGHVGINTAAGDFASNDFAERLLRRLDEAGVPPTALEVEVTETVILSRGGPHVQRALIALAEAGLRIALDDFGTGYASLATLKQLPIASLKIDQSFVAGLGRSPRDQAIVGAIADLSGKLGIETVAEGVETGLQAGWLSKLGVSCGQGYWFGRAAPPEEVSLGLLHGFTAAVSGPAKGALTA